MTLTFSQKLMIITTVKRATFL